MNEKVYSCEWLGRTLTVKTGKLARQASAALTVQYGDTVVLATVVESKDQREGIDFFPLMVEFEERLYAAGIIKGSRWIKREGRPSDDAVLTGRMIDRAIRPLFDQSSRNETQLILTVLSFDQENDYDVVSLVAAAAVLCASGINWNGPIGGIRVGRVEGKFVFNPTYAEQALSDLDLVIAGTPDKLLMVEAGANEVKQEDILKAVTEGLAAIKPVFEMLKAIKADFPLKTNGKTVKELSAEEKEAAEAKKKVLNIAEEWLKNNIKNILFDKVYYTKGERKAAVAAIKEGLDKFLSEQGISKDKRSMAINSLVEEMVEIEVTNAILNEKKRVDGRALDEIRLLTAEVGVLPRNHGAGLFSRGETQVMSIATLGSPGMEQQTEGLEGAGTKRYMHHYNFPPYATGETKAIRTTGRREIGHGALAEKALIPVLPSKEDFPYTVRVVSETLGSNGSSSMASACASTLALMDAGVPIKKHVGGLAMGLASNADMSRWEILTDLQDLEDGEGGMDFKITGTVDGLTAIQLDTKTTGLSMEIVKKTLEQGTVALGRVLQILKEALPEPRPELSKYAPRITSFRINPDKIREVIGTGGKIINEIIAATGVTIDIEDDGLVMVCGVDAAKVQEAVTWVDNIVREFKPGEIFKGKVVRLLDFGAFIELVAGRDGMAHVSELAPYRVEKPSDFINIGDTVTVKIKEIDEQGRVNLTLKGLPENEHLWKDEKGKSNGFGAPRFNGNGNGRDRFSGGRDNRDRGGFRR